MRSGSSSGSSRWPARATAEPDGSAARRERDRQERRLARLRLLAWWLDDWFRVPWTRWRFGLDGLIGLVPGAGDAVTAALAGYIVVEAWRLGVPRRLLARMALNVGIDLAVGAVPVAGDLFDFGWKSNRRNLALLTCHLERERGHPAAGPMPRPLREPAAGARGPDRRSG